jgi:signal transduction histidine kinase
MSHTGGLRFRTRPTSLWCIAILVLAAMFELADVPVWAQTSQKHVLVLYATRRDAQIALIGDREIPRILDAALEDGVDYHSEYIDRARFGSSDYRKAFGSFLRSKYNGQQFDVVIAMQDVALDLVVDNRDALFASTPIVFVSTLADSPRLPNSTGIVAPLNLRSTLTLALTLQPDTRNVFVVSGADDGAKVYAQQAREQLRMFQSRVSISYLEGLATRELDAAISSLPDRSILYYLVANRDGAGQVVQPLEYLDHLASVANAPIYSWVDSTIGHGVVGGSLKSLTAQTNAAAGMALRVLNGESADSIPVATDDFNVNQLDLRQLRDWGISENRAPAGTQVLFREPSAWARYKYYIVGAAAIVTAETLLILLLLVEGSRRRLAEERARGSEAALRSSHDRIRDLGGRLLGAQETERARIARELHDDVSQQLALLSIDLELLGDHVEPRSTDLAEAAMNRAQEIARSVHDLSHRLHPAKLRLIGLIAGIHGLRNEMSSGGMVISFNHNHVPPSFPADLTLCLFRVVQEALQNAVKYSNATKVAIDLSCEANRLTLNIADNGVGFDVRTAWGTGLGLISMSERLEAFGGAIDIQSTRGAGTQLAIDVPLTSHLFQGKRLPQTARAQQKRTREWTADRAAGV